MDKILQNNEIIASIDIGTTKVTAWIIEWDKNTDEIKLPPATCSASPKALS